MGVVDSMQGMQGGAFISKFRIYIMRKTLTRVNQFFYQGFCRHSYYHSCLIFI